MASFFALVPFGLYGNARMTRQTPEKPTLRGLLGEATTEFSGFSGGVPYTVKCLLCAPGATVRRYLDGGKTRITRPLRLFVMALMLYFAAASLGGINELNVQSWQQLLSSDRESASAFLEFFTRYQTALFAIVLPLMMLATRIAWPRSGRTLAEHLILNTFLFTAQLLIIIPLMALGWALGSRGIEGAVIWIHGIVIPMLAFGYAAWMMATFFSGSRTWSSIRAIAIQLGMLLPYWLIVLAIFQLWTKVKGIGAV